jgi:hypothetical protein
MKIGSDVVIDEDATWNREIENGCGLDVSAAIASAVHDILQLTI